MKKSRILGIASLCLIAALAVSCGDSTSTNKSKFVGGTMQGVALKLSGTASTLAGGTKGEADGTGTAAEFGAPFGITTDGTNLYVTDSYGSIRMIIPSTGVVTTLAGSLSSTGCSDGTGTAATFKEPQGITSDGTNLYVTDGGCNTIRKIVISTGVVTTLAGTAGTSGHADGTGTAATFMFPTGITTDGTNLYVADSNNDTIRKIVISSGVVTTLAGTAGTYGTANGTGTAATFEFPVGITTDGTNLYVTDYNTHDIRKIVISSGVVTTLAGTAGTSGHADGTGTAATFEAPSMLTTDGTNLYVSDSVNSTIRKIVISSGVVTTLAGTPGASGTADGSSPLFVSPWGETILGGKLYVTEFLGGYAVRMIE
jgi:hypothetical protein